MAPESGSENPTFFLVYVSSATRPFFREDLRVLLETCRKNNAELGVKGMLLYKDGNFTQVLKGTRVPYAGSTRGSPPTPATAARSPYKKASPRGASSPTGPWVSGTWTRPRRDPIRAIASSSTPPHRPRVLRRPLPSPEAPDHVQEDHVSKARPRLGLLRQGIGGGRSRPWRAKPR